MERRNYKSQQNFNGKIHVRDDRSWREGKKIDEGGSAKDE